MAIRVEELEPPREAQIYAFPAERARNSERARAARRRVAARRASVARRRAALAATVVVIAVMMLFAGGPASVSSADSARTPRKVTVQAGQTLWSLAERYAPRGVDPRAYVDAVLALNDLSGPPMAGAVIRLPR